MFPPKGDERRAPELEWAEAFHSTTAALIPLVLDARMEDATLQRLLRDMEALLNGHQVTLTDVLHEVEVTVRTLEGRYSHRSAVTQLHEVVRQIAGRISNIRTLLDRYVEPAIGLAVLDHYVKAPDTDPEPGAPERSAAWRPIIEELRSLLSDARQLWGADTAHFDAKPANILTRASAGTTKCGPIERNSAHEVVIAIGRLILDPSDSGALRQNELGRVAGVVDMPAETTRDVARLRVVRELASRQWWSDVELGLEREYAQAVTPPSWASSPRRPHEAQSTVTANADSLAHAKHTNLPDTSERQPADNIGEQGGERREHRLRAQGGLHTHETTDTTSTDDGNGVRLAATFVKSGSHWIVGMAGQTSTATHSKGMNYIKTLLMSPNSPVHTWTMSTGNPPPRDAQAPLVDRQTIQSLREQIDQMQVLQDESRDQEQREHLEEEMARLRRYIAQATRKQGNTRTPRLQRDDKEKVRETVGKAIIRAIEKLMDACPEVGEHLKACIASPTGMEPCYKCPVDQLPAWELGESQPGKR
jgi:hypothetical protein